MTLQWEDGFGFGCLRRLVDADSDKIIGSVHYEESRQEYHARGTSSIIGRYRTSKAAETAIERWHRELEDLRARIPGAAEMMECAEK